MADSITLRVITPEKIVLDTTASAVQIPAIDGSMGILPRHGLTLQRTSLSIPFLIDRIRC